MHSAATAPERATADALAELLERFDGAVLPPTGRDARVRLEDGTGGAWDIALAARGDRPRLVRPSGRPDATIVADSATWKRIAGDGRAGLDAFHRGRLRVRGNMHLVVGLLAATSGDRGPGRLRMRNVRTRLGRISVTEAGTGRPVLMVHGLGGTKVSFLTTVAALSGEFRAVAMDLPGFGDSVKPVRGRYDAAWLARAVADLVAAMELDRPHLIGNSLGGRVALEVGFAHPGTVDRLVLLTPSLAWLRGRRWARPLQLVRPELGLLQPAPYRLVEPLVRRLVPGSRHGWVAVGVDEFLRSYRDPRGRAAFYAAARSIYLEDPAVFWQRLETLAPDSLFVWGRRDPLVPLGFMRHVQRALPAARHVELDCGHVPQLEAPARTHAAIRAFLT